MRWSRRKVSGGGSPSRGGSPSGGEVVDPPARRVLVRATALLADGVVVGPVQGVLLVDGDDVRLEVPADWPDDEAMAALRPRHDLPVIARVLRPDPGGACRRAVVEFSERVDRLRVVLWASR